MVPLTLLATQKKKKVQVRKKDKEKTLNNNHNQLRRQAEFGSPEVDAAAFNAGIANSKRSRRLDTTRRTEALMIFQREQLQLQGHAPRAALSV